MTPTPTLVMYRQDKTEPVNLYITIQIKIRIDIQLKKSDPDPNEQNLQHCKNNVKPIANIAKLRNMNETYIF
jgi:hypothetical protein